jgi:hypothetical protein
MPLKTVKEVASILKESLDGEVYERMQVYQALRVKELFAKLLNNIHILPDFKTRLIDIQKKNAGPDGIVGLADGIRDDNKILRVKVQETPGWVSMPSTSGKDFHAVQPFNEPITCDEGNVW